MLYFTYWRCCAHDAAGMAVGAALAVLGIVAIAGLAVSLEESNAAGSDCVDLGPAAECASGSVAIGLLVFAVIWLICCIDLVVGVARDMR